MRKAFAYRLYTNKTQDKSLTGLLDIARLFYNSALQERRDAWEQGISINYYDQANQLKGIRTENTCYTLLNFSATQDVLRRLDKSFKSFFRRVKTGEKAGYPRFKGRDRFDSIAFPTYGDGVKLTDKLYIQNVGKLRINMHRPIEGQIKTVSIKRKCSNWYAIFSCDLGDDIAPKTEFTNLVGIDVGLESFAVLSDGTVIDNPRYFRHGEQVLADRQRKLSAKQRGSNRRKDAKFLVAKAHQKIANQRTDFHHKLSRQLADKYDFIAYEDLSINNMVKNHSLAKSISDAGWGQFLRFSCYKVEETGGTSVAVNPKGTSQECSWCGSLVSKTLGDRIHNCPNCGKIAGRDYNASRNILWRGLRLRGIPREAVCFS
jgi:putative transposase